MGQATLIPSRKKFSIESLGPTLRLDAALGVGTTGARSLSAARKESFVLASKLDPGLNSFWVSFWVKPASIAVADYTIISTKSWETDTTGFAIRRYGPNLVALFDTTGVGNTVSYSFDSFATAVGRWTHFVVVFDRTANTMSAYINGALYSGTGNIAAKAGEPCTPSSYVSTIGSQYGGVDAWEDGSLSRMGYGLGVPTVDEVTELYNQGNGKYYAELSAALESKVVHYWNLNESSLSAAIDAKGTNDGAIFGANLLTNPGFETLGGGGADVFASWTESVAGTSTVSSDTGRSGSYSCKFTIDALGSQASVTQPGSPPTAARRYAWSFYGKSNPAGRDVVVADGLGNVGVYTMTASWAQYSGSGLVTPSITFKRSGSISEELWIDDLSLTSAQIDSAAGPREAMASDLVGGYHGVLTNMDTVAAWSTDTPDGSYTATKVDSVGTAHGTMTGFTDIDAAHVDGPDGSWGPAITDRGSSPAQGWLLSSVKDSRSASVPSTLNTRVFDEYYTEPASTGSRWLTGTQRLDGTDAFDSVGATVISLAAWIYHTNTAATRAIASTTASVTTSPGIKLWLTSAHQLYVTVRTSTPVSDSHGWTVAIPAYQWVHVGCTVNATTGLICLYVNGTLVASKTSSLGGTLFESGASWVGNYGTAESIEGAIACITASDSIEWSVSDFQTLFNGGKARKYADLPAAMQARIGSAFDLDGSTTEVDEVAGVKTLTVTNGPISTAASPYLPAFDATLTGFTSSPRSADVPTVLVGKCKSIQGATDKYATTGVATVSGMGARSAAIWLKRNGVPSVNGIIMGDAANVSDRGLQVIAGTNGYVYFHIFAAGSTIATVNTGASICDNAWHFLEFDWDGTTAANKVILRVDGGTPITATATATSQGGASSRSFQIIGANGTAGAEWDGLVCRPQIWNGRALTSAESSTLLAGGDVTEGLTAEWRFNEPDTITVPFEHALECDGANTIVDCGGEILGSGAVTVSGWVLADTVGESSIGRITENEKTIFSITTGNVLQVHNDGATSVAMAVDSMSLGAWSHVAFTRDDTGHTEIFLNGRRCSLNRLHRVNAGTPASGTTNLYIANRPALDRTWDGRIGQVRIDNTALTQAQIRQLALGQSPTTPAHDWRFDDPLDLPYLDGCRAIRFDGVDDRVNTGLTTAISANALTITGWMLPFGYGSGGRIIDNGSTIFLIGNTGIMTFSSTNGGTTALSSNNAYSMGVWQHVAVTRDAAGLATLYINGVLTGTADTSSGTPVAGATATCLGNRQAADRTFDGMLADIRIYDGVRLTQAQIRQIIDGTDYLTGLSASWKFGETPRSIPSCAGGYALKFDGTDDYVLLANSNYPINLTEFTISAWIKPSSFPGNRMVISGSNWERTLYHDSSGKLIAVVNAVTDAGSTSSESLVAGVWSHVAMKYSDTGDRKIRLYINGVEVSYSVQTAAVGAVVSTASTTLRLGHVDTQYYNGSIDDARIYNSVLSDGDILLLAQGGDPASSPYNHWTMDDGPQYGEPSNGDPICVWESREGINFVQTSQAACPTYLQSGANGRPGLTFDGVDDYLRQAGWIPSETSGTFVIAAKINSVASANAIFSSCDEGGLGSYFYVGTTATTGYHSLEQRNAGDTSDAIASAGALGTTSVRIASYRSDGSLSSARLDGTNYPLSTILAGVNNGDWLGDTTLRDSAVIGALARSTLSFFLSGIVYEIIYFPYALSDVQLRKVEKALGAKYGVTVA